MRPFSFAYLNFVLILSLILSACGFELRNYANSLDNQTISLDANNSFLNLEMENQLNLKGYLNPSYDSQSTISIKILNHVVNRYVGSAGPGATTTQVRLDYKILYSLKINGARETQHTFEDKSYIDFNQSDLLAFEREEEITKEDFIRKAIRNMEFVISANLNEIK